MTVGIRLLLIFDAPFARNTLLISKCGYVQNSVNPASAFYFSDVEILNREATLCGMLYIIG
ncbi:hypothetical protein ABXJ76_04560 [Methylobacter sp. G7]|uniref:hypothetical protein n=1 Tax=Methylobacter sp. G7 TaxID=3230117 RepID=UPI003D801E58